MAKTRILTVRVDSQLAAALSAQAALDGYTISALIRRLMMEHMLTGSRFPYESGKPAPVALDADRRASKDASIADRPTSEASANGPLTG